MKPQWDQTIKLPSKNYVCGHCNESIAEEDGYVGGYRDHRGSMRTSFIYICHFCGGPTYFDENEFQFPGSKFGENVRHINNASIEALYDEARSCFSVSAFTSSVICCRKLLMNISVAEGAKEGEAFAFYVNFLNDNGHIPKNGKKWVDSIRKLGNEANHSISLKTKDEAKLILTFTAMLLKFIYEMPGMLGNADD